MDRKGVVNVSQFKCAGGTTGIFHLCPSAHTCAQGRSIYHSFANVLNSHFTSSKCASDPTSLKDK